MLGRRSQERKTRSSKESAPVVTPPVFSRKKRGRSSKDDQAAGTSASKKSSAASRSKKENQPSNLSLTPSLAHEQESKEHIKPTNDDTVFLEKGHIYFLYRPKVQLEHAEGLDDVQRMFILLKPLQPNESHYVGPPEYQPKNRLLIVGKKKLPGALSHEKYFGFVWKSDAEIKVLTETLDKEEYDTATRGHRVVESARPCGEGVYGIVTHHGHTHLAYVLEVPQLPGEVQQAMNIEKEGSLILSIKNPEKPGPKWAGLPTSSKAAYAEALNEKFLGHSFIPANPSSFLDYSGAEILLIGASDDLVSDLPAIGKDLEEWEDEETIDVQKLKDEKVFQELHLDRHKFKAGALFGNWE